MITSTQRREQFCSNLFVVFDVGVLLSGTFHSACSLILPNTDYGIFFLLSLMVPSLVGGLAFNCQC